MSRLCFLLLFVSFYSTPIPDAEAQLPLNTFKPDQHLPGGSHTHSRPVDRHSFLHASPMLSPEQGLDFRVGQAIFEKIWVFSPSSTTASDGLGPLYHARSCHRCHVRNGRGQVTSPVIHGGNASSPVSLILRLSIPALNAKDKALLSSGIAGVIPEPTYGTQLQTFAYPGGKSEAQIRIHYTRKAVLVGDESIELLQPDYRISSLAYGPLHEQVQISPRIAPPVIGLGLLEAIAAEDLVALSDPNDDNRDGISGKLNWVWNIEQQTQAIGRFGWKAGQPTLKQQNAAALNKDIGISSRLYPYPAGDCTDLQSECHQQSHGTSDIHDGQEASENMVAHLLYYTRFIAVPPRRNSNKPNVLAGQKLFHQAGCAACHHPSFLLPENTEVAQFSAQHIWPYTDLLLHDMGEALADHRPEFSANGREWRTPPLWGIGLTRMLGEGTFFLHDGRARTLLEAILWHGGEAEAAKQTVLHFSQTQRTQLIEFLESL